MSVGTKIQMKTCDGFSGFSHLAEDVALFELKKNVENRTHFLGFFLVSGRSLHLF